MAAKFEGSARDRADDKRNSKRLGVSLKTYEKSAIDRKADAKGQRTMDKKRKRKKG